MNINFANEFRRIKNGNLKTSKKIPEKNLSSKTGFFNRKQRNME